VVAEILLSEMGDHCVGFKVSRFIGKSRPNRACDNNSKNK